MNSLFFVFGDSNNASSRRIKIMVKFILSFLSLVGLFLTAQSQMASNLVPLNSATHTAVQNGSWFDPNTWDAGSVPGDAAIVVIPFGTTVTYEGQSTAHIFAIRVDGVFECQQSNAADTTRLRFDTFVAGHMSWVRFEADGPSDGNIVVEMAPFPIEAHKAGTSGYSQNWNAAATSHFTDGDSVFQVTYSVGPDNRFNSYTDALAGNTSVTETSRMQVDDGPGVWGRYQWDSTQLSLGMVVMGQIEIRGQEKLNMARLSQDALRNQALLQLDSLPWGWEIGDSLVVTRGGNLGASQNGKDVVAIQSISGSTVTCTSNLNRNHEGRLQDDLHCYVGNLTRNITFRSLQPDSITHRGHFMVMHNDSNVVVENASFRDLGRTDKSRLLDDMVWSHWLQPKVFRSKISALGQECAEMALLPHRDVTNMRGRYSIHLHKTGATFNSKLVEVTGNVIWGNPGWGITHHDAYADVSRNVVYQVTGAGIVSESGSEMGFWDDNLVVDVQKGHNTDVYEAALFHDDYLYSGQGLGMKGRAVVCRGNVIANANQGVGVLNMNPSVNNLDRVDPVALAHFRPGFQFDQFPLDQNGYSVEGDGVMPVEVALIMENTTVINCYQGLRSIERDMGVNHESRSIFDGYRCWGISQGLSITYQADYSFKDVFISGRNSNAIGAFLWKHSHNHVFDGIKMVDLAYGVTVSKLVENGNNQKTRNNGFTPWYFIDLDTANVGQFYEILKENTSTSTVYDEHGDNPIHLSSQDLVSRPTTFTILDSSQLAVDVGGGDLQFEVDGVVTDDLGSYDMGIKQAWAQGTLRLDYPQRIYEFASLPKFEEYLQQHGVYKDTSNNDQLYFIVDEWLPNRRSYDYTRFPIRINILNAPATGVYANPMIESPPQLTPQYRLVSRMASASQSSTDTTLQYQGTPIDAGAWKATDGNNNGRINVQFYQQGLVPVGSFAATEVELEPWFDLDLGELSDIEFIDIWNTVELNGADIEQPSPHFRNFYVLISDSAFMDSTLSHARLQASHEYFKDSIPSRKFSLNHLGAVGRYVRIMGVGTGKLAMAEVEVVGKTYIDSTCIPIPVGTEVVVACDSFTWGNGTTYYASGLAQDTLVSSLGCDSLVTLDLTIQHLDAQISLTGSNLEVNVPGDSIQWIGCNGNLAIAGANGQMFSPASSGTYAAVVYENSCVDTSNCLTVTITGHSSALSESIKLYPNPNSGTFFLDLPAEMEEAKLTIYDARGLAISPSQTLVPGKNEIHLDLAAGVYSAVVHGRYLHKVLQFIVQATD